MSPPRLRRVISATAMLIALFATSAQAQVQGGAIVQIDQARGVDQQVVYKRLAEDAIWDDRNYQLRKQDLAELPSNDQRRHDVPTWFKILKRREMLRDGFPLEDIYPRELDKEFAMRFGGPIQNGVLQRIGLGVYHHPDPNNPPPPLLLATDPLPHAVPVQGEGPFDGNASDNETSIEFHPTNPLIVIAGSNSNTDGQRQSFSSDGGVTWMSAGALPSSCCDPAMDWSPDGSIAYAATLGNASGAGFLRTEIYQSTNSGETWSAPISPSTAGSDKEFIHVDKSPTSPFRGRVYVTWHQGNTMCFARSALTVPNLVFAPTQCFPLEERGIGSDITTDAQGNIYYVYPSVTNGSTEIRVLRSADGGATFAASVAAYELWGDFDFSIPSMEERRAFIYVAADVDQSGGPRAGRVYIAFTDKHPSSPPEGVGTPEQNHAWVRVVYSDNQGATWTTAATPHAVADVAIVDRYHPWLDVDSQGIVHIGFYDTRHSVDRTGVDWYYTLSPNGGTTWVEETRVSAGTSRNIDNGQEWGDYNGLSVASNGAGSVVAMTWTDNRIFAPAPNPTQQSFAGRVENEATNGTFYLSTQGESAQAVCTLLPAANPATLFGNSFEFLGARLAPLAIDTFAFGGFNSIVNLSFVPVLPVGMQGSFFPASLTPPSTSVVSLGITAATAPGVYTIGLQATGGGETRQSSLLVNVSSALPSAPTLVSPANNAARVSTVATLSWTVTQGSSSVVEVSTTSNFSNIVFTRTLTNSAASAAVAPALRNNTQYFWRVRSSNSCGGGPNSAVFSFRTVAAPGECETGVVANTVFFDNVENGDNGWTTSSGTTPPTQVWSRSTARPFSQSNAWLAVDVPSVSEQQLVSPPIVMPSDQNPLTLSFQQDRSLEPRGGGCWDGGIVEYSTNDGVAWTQVTPAQILQAPYSGTLGNGSSGTGLQAWCGEIPYIRTIVDLSSLAGQTIRLRYRVFSDGSVGFVPHGWYIDDVRVQGCPSN